MIALLKKLLSEIASLGHAPGEVWFRGQADANWPLVPSLIRRSLDQEAEKNLLARFRSRAMGIIRDHPADNDRVFILAPMALNEWQIGRRVLVGPYVRPCIDSFSASFKGSDQPSETIAIWAYASNDRIARQRGAFTVHGSKDIFESTVSDTILRSLVVRSQDKAEVRRHLEYLGVSRTSLFNDLDSLADELRSQYGNTTITG
jgi:hypothetical protein